MIAKYWVGRMIEHQLYKPQQRTQPYQLGESSCWWLVAVVVVMSFSHGCKKLPSTSADTPQPAQLSSVVDDQYILMMAMVQPDGSQTAGAGPGEDREQLYEFITCALEHHVDVNRGRWPGYPHTKNPVTRSANPATPQRLVRYQLNPSDPYNFTILPDSCVPTYQNAAGASLYLNPHNIGTHRVGAAKNELKLESSRQDIAQGTHYFAAFGFGGMLSGFSNQVRQALGSLLPQAIKGKSLVAFMGQIGLTLPFSGHNAYLLAQYDSDTYAVVMPHQVGERSAQRRHELTSTEWVGAAASGAAGFAAAQVIINESAKAGPLGALVGYVLVPFVATVVVNTRTNHAQHILDKFQQIFAIHDPQQIEDSVASGAMTHTTSIPEITRILGQTLVLAGWASSVELNRFCMPRAPFDDAHAQCVELAPNR